MKLIPVSTVSATGPATGPVPAIPEPDKLRRFWNALKKVNTPREPHDILALTNGTNFLGDEDLPSAIYVRPCYLKLLEKTMSIINCDNTPRLVILGNPGIGKTYFGYYLLAHIARNGGTVVYESGTRKQRYLLSTERVAIGSLQDFSDVMRERNHYYVVDGTPPVHCVAKTVLVSSHRRDVWYTFSKTKCTIRYMPVWTLDEIQTCRQQLFPEVDETVAKDCFLKWGGIPRFVLQFADDKAQQELLMQAIGSVDLDAISSAIGRTEAGDQATHRLIHMVVADDFMERQYKFASDVVAEGVYRALYERDRARLLQFLRVAHNASGVEGLRGTIFEQHAHWIISQGGTFQIRTLPKPASPSPVTIRSNLHLPQLPVVYFQRDTEVQSSTGSYFRPRITNYESVDSFSKPNRLFQITVGAKHPCKQAGLYKVLNLLQNPREPEFYFVVPDDKFESFRFRKYEDSVGLALEEPTFNNVKSIRQFVLKIDLSS